MNLIQSFPIVVMCGLFLSACGSSSGGGSAPPEGYSVATEPNTETETEADESLALGLGVKSDFAAGSMSVTSSSLSFGGSTRVTVNVVRSETSELFTSGSVAVNFTSYCAGLTPALATIDAIVNTHAGIATATYNATGCIGTDIITATIDGATAITNVNIASQDIGSVKFVSI